MISTNSIPEVTMKAFRSFLIFATVCSMLIGSAPGATPNASASAIDEHDHHHRLPPATHKELAQARRATAKYFNVEQAVADGYVNINLHLPGEGIHYVNFSL